MPKMESGGYVMKLPGVMLYLEYQTGRTSLCWTENQYAQARLCVAGWGVWGHAIAASALISHLSAINDCVFSD